MCHRCLVGRWPVCTASRGSVRSSREERCEFNGQPVACLLRRRAAGRSKSRNSGKRCGREGSRAAGRIVAGPWQAAARSRDSGGGRNRGIGEQDRGQRRYSRSEGGARRVGEKRRRKTGARVQGGPGTPGRQGSRGQPARTPSRQAEKPRNEQHPYDALHNCFYIHRSSQGLLARERLLDSLERLRPSSRSYHASRGSSLESIGGGNLPPDRLPVKSPQR